MSTDNNWLPLNADVGGQPNTIKKILTEEEIIEFNMYQDKECIIPIIDITL